MSAREPRRYRYGRKALMMGDGGRGMRLQLHGVFAQAGPDEWVPTGIMESAVKLSRDDDWAISVAMCGEAFPSISTALDAYEATLAGVAYG